MPGRDGSGPLGRGAMSGRGMGFCAPSNAVRYGAGLGLGLGLGMGLGYGCRRGLGRGLITEPRVYKTDKEVLTAQREVLQNRLDAISAQLENIPEGNK